MEPEILHEQEGLTIKRNSKNTFVVCTLHYTADPAKRSAKWLDTVKAGMTTSQFEREYEISYTAQFGERVFPEFLEKKDLIIVPEFEAEGQVWAGFDYGARNPSSFHVYTFEGGCFYAVWELYKPCKNIPEFAQELKSCPYYSRLRYIAADPSLWGKRTHNAAGEPESVANLFIKEGIIKLIPGSTDESAWIGVMRKHWEQDDPGFKIATNCRGMLREFEGATFQDYASDKMSANANFKEAMRDKDNHALDDCKYFFNSQPIVAKGFKGKIKQDNASRWYGWGGQPRKHGNLGEGTPAHFGASNAFTRFREKEFADGQRLGWGKKGEGKTAADRY